MAIKRITALFLICLLLLQGVGMPISLAQQEVPQNTTSPAVEEHLIMDEQSRLVYIDNCVVLVLQPEVKEAEALSWFPDENAQVVGRFPVINQIQVQIEPKTLAQLQALCDEMMKKEQVRFAHLNLATAPYEPGPQSASDSGLYGKKPENEWWYEAIGLKEAQRLRGDAAPVKVAVVDDGFDTTHPDLKLRFVGQEQEAQNSLEEHGTHVAGVVQQILPDATIYVHDAYKTPSEQFSSRVNTTCEFLKIWIDLVTSGVKVINYSMGGDVSDPFTLPWHVLSSSIDSVYIYLLKQAGYDFILVQSAGNSDIDTYYNSMFCTIDERNCLGSDAARQFGNAQGSRRDHLFPCGCRKNTGELWAPGPRWRGPDVPRREPSRSPLYGQLKDKCGFRWVIISSERLWYQAQLKMF
jgi:hypothetical protein